MTMDDYKSLLASKTVWGGILALLAGVAGIFGYTVSPVDQAQAIDSVSGIVAAFGGILAIYGRIKATKIIKK
jgi:uncharacterized membrane protein HdeD (DUF308 family)